MKDNLTVNIEGLKKSLREMGINNLEESKVLGEVYFMLSLECNLRCRVCAWWGIKGPCRSQNFLARYRSTLTLKELKKFTNEIAPLNPKTVSFSGGEPLLYKKWYLLAQYLHKKGFRISLTTNGILLWENFAKIKETVNEINLSLGGPPSILPLIRESPISHFRRIMRGLKVIANFKKRNNRPSLRILYTISDLSYAHMEDLIKFMESHDIAIDHYKFQHLMFVGPKTFQQQKEVFLQEFKIKDLSLWQGYTYSPSRFDFARFKKEIARVKKYKNTSFSPDLSAEELESYYQDNKGALSYSRYCTAPWHQLNIMPDGKIYICHDYFIGNIKEKSFEKIWNGQKTKRLRLYLTRKLFPGCKGCFYHYCDRVR